MNKKAIIRELTFIFFDISAENTDNNVRYQNVCNFVGYVICKGHYGKGKKRRHGDLEIVPINAFDCSHHKKTYIFSAVRKNSIICNNLSCLCVIHM